MPTHSLSEQVADVVLALVNAQPRTPSKAQLVAAIAEVLPGASKVQWEGAREDLRARRGRGACGQARHLGGHVRGAVGLPRPDQGRAARGAVTLTPGARAAHAGAQC
jgi:hypothetical protein